MSTKEGKSIFDLKRPFATRENLDIHIWAGGSAFD